MVSENSKVKLTNLKLKVLILVLMEDGLGEQQSKIDELEIKGLNPCFNGKWSRR